MSQISFDHSDTTEAGLNIYANKVADFKECNDWMYHVIRNVYGRESLLIFCEDENARSIWTLLFKQKITSCIFVADMLEDVLLLEHSIEKNPFAENTQLVGKVGRKGEPDVSSRFCCVNDRGKSKVQMLHMEFMDRKRDCPQWMAEYVIDTFCPPELHEQRMADEREQRRKRNQRSIFSEYREVENIMTSSETTGSPMSSFLNRSVTSPVPSIGKENRSSINSRNNGSFNIHNIMPNADGKYIIPFQVVDYNNHYDQDEEMDFSDDNSVEADYDYDEQDEYDHEFI
uniref:PH domain-like protein n=1 Tax=Caenorhabditis tropicalis TaxID=1561998 RepID=A0A1I7U895_9PELO